MQTISTTFVVLQFALATLLPVVAGVLLTKLSDHTPLRRMGYWPKQVLYGVIFGCIAIFGTEFGINTLDATMNVRDAAPIVAGLYFGSPAGIIAGLIGGIERWFSVLWGRGMFTRVACSVATCVSGIYAALLNRYLFDKRKPSWSIALAVGMVAEVLHLLLVFLTNMDNASKAFFVVQACSFPMIFCNSVSVALAGGAIAYTKGVSLFRHDKPREISQTIQAGMLGVVAFGFAATLAFTYTVQQSTSLNDTQDALALAMKDMKADVRDASDANLLGITRDVAKEIPSVASAKKTDLAELAMQHGVSEIHVIDKSGIIVASSEDEYLGFDMSSGEQAAAFLDLLPGGTKTNYVQDYQPMTMDSTRMRKFAGARIEDGFIQTSYDASHFSDDILSEVQTAVRNRHVGKSGMFILLNARGTLAGMRSDINVADVNASTLRITTDQNEPDAMFETTIHGVSYYAMYEDVEGFRIIALIPVEEAMYARDLAVLVTSFMEVLVLAALFAAIYILIRNVVVRSIWQVNGTLDKITSGDLKAEVDVRDSSEFASLSDDINQTVASLRDAIAAESARIERDLATAKAIQESALPRTFPPFPDIDAFDIYASMNAAREVGGDFYDFFLIDDHTLGFLIADVSGKGIPASLFMMAAKSELANYIKSGMDLAEAVQSANWNLCQGNEAGMFVTVWAATLDYNTGRLTYVNAGHNPPLLRHNNSWQWLKERGGLFLGTFEIAKYRSSSMYLSPSDELLLYTDGVNEAFSAGDEEYGNDRLEAFLGNHADMHPHMLIDMLRADLRRWADGAEQSDDITMLCLEYGVAPEVSGVFKVPATQAGLDELRRNMHFALSQLACPENVQGQIELTMEELFANIAQHGYLDASGDNQVQVAYIYNTNPSSITVSITDWGEPFNPLKYEGPKEGEGDEVTGMGITLAVANADDFSYVRDEDCNVLAFRKSW
ncbi:MAG: SpoIIE family protein phosphatase [Coriobacteriales bacterium]|nr:SpoIIE family protein phosphatase [Coriobacteriales bacterium]